MFDGQRTRRVLVGDERATLTSVLQWQRDTLMMTEFHVDDVDVAGSFKIWEDTCVRSRAVVDAAGSLDVTGSYDGQTYSLHYVLTHMIEEYARHNGHADLLREAIDGTTGE
ncbi:DUF664 domain-containing protein [Streptomyces sp. ISL-66]|uniref:mycothiol transferase n=1 Tax=Streptomyces sp. ISL-66 TaxID=2819186 RepID=UPI001BEC5728|nr:DUF664 domain-containing protein [Streptomyces sp. ISL-66]MBT2466888.1 DUF664 domain-containing protein [Streptomyces sp. ISL-66]